jgi:hypothetical protein
MRSLPSTSLILPLILSTACALMSGGCGSSYAAPKLRVTNATVAERTDAGVVLDFTVEADNVNEEALPLREVRYDVYVDQRKVFSGYRSPEATLRRFGTQQVRLPAVIATGPGQTPPSGTASYRVVGTLVYFTPGSIAEILFENDLRKPSVSFSEDGQVDLSAAPTRTSGT